MRDCGDEIAAREGMRRLRHLRREFIDQRRVRCGLGAAGVVVEPHLDRPATFGVERHPFAYRNLR